MSTEKIIEVMAKAMMDYAKTLPPASSFHCLLRSHRLECANAALTALQSSGYMVIEGWRKPTEADKGGRDVIGWRSDDGEIFLTRYTCMEAFMTEKEMEGYDEETCFADDWFFADFLQGGRLAKDDAPTLVMPLPPPPQAQGESEERSDTDGAESSDGGLTHKEAPNG
jgi:hypothetical protein